MKVMLITLILCVLTSCGGDQSGAGAHKIDLSKKLETSPTINYQIGESWGAKSVDGQFLQSLNSFNHSRLAQNMVRVRTSENLGSGFYLGKINGEHIIATNAHVLGKSIHCSIFPIVVQFSLYQKSFSCKRFVGSWMNVDFALFSLKVESSAGAALLDRLNPLEIDFSYSPIKGERLISAGHGQYKNTNMNLTMNDDEDCKVYSPSATIAKVSNPNNQKKKVKSIAIGCDISPGDSGGPVLSKRSGLVSGIIWGTKTPKPNQIRQKNYLAKIYNNDDLSVWENMAYMVSPHAIREELLRWARRVEVSNEMDRRREIVEKLVY